MRASSTTTPAPWAPRGGRLRISPGCGGGRDGSDVGGGRRSWARLSGGGTRVFRSASVVCSAPAPVQISLGDDCVVKPGCDRRLRVTMPTAIRSRRVALREQQPAVSPGPGGAVEVLTHAVGHASARTTPIAADGARPGSGQPTGAYQAREDGQHDVLSCHRLPPARRHRRAPPRVRRCRVSVASSEQFWDIAVVQAVRRWHTCRRATANKLGLPAG